METNLTNFTFSGSLNKERSIQRAVQSVLQEGDCDVDSLATNVAYMLAAILETLPTDEVVRVLNASSIKTWRAVEYAEESADGN